LPDKIWLGVFQNLPVRSVNNVHLVCRKFHGIANLYVNPRLYFDGKSSRKDLESLLKSFRIFEELEFPENCDDYLFDQENFQPLEEYLGFTGPYIKKLSISKVKVHQKILYTSRFGGANIDPLILRHLLHLLPNLESLKMDYLSLKQSIKWNLKSSKIEQIEANVCADEVEDLLEALDKCAIKEAKFGYWSQRESVAIEKFLESQEKSLKNLTIQSDLDLPKVIKDLSLESLDFDSSNNEDVSLEALKQLENLKFLRLNVRGSGRISDKTLDVICELRSLETLELTMEYR
jgi:hypothetical protein